MARKLHPGQKNNLDALCKRYDVDNTQRELHGALLDAEILADVYLRITGGQVSMLLDAKHEQSGSQVEELQTISTDRPPLRVIHASEQEISAHEARLASINKDSKGKCVWLREEEPAV